MDAKTYTLFEIKCLHITSRVTSNEKDYEL